MQHACARLQRGFFFVAPLRAAAEALLRCVAFARRALLRVAVLPPVLRERRARVPGARRIGSAT